MNVDLSMTAGARVRSVLSVPKMDCPSEENLIRMALGKVTGIETLSFDLGARVLTVDHHGPATSILNALALLNLGAQLRGSEPLPGNSEVPDIMFASTLGIPKMDCPSEENMIRMALADINGIQSLDFDLLGRQLRVMHSGEIQQIVEKLGPLGLGTHLVESTRTNAVHLPRADASGDASEARTLRLLLAINAVMFFVEITWGLIAQSAGLVADSLDMFADAAVYGLALYAVGRAVSMKARAAHLAGWLQMILAIGALAEVIRRFLFGSDPESSLMMSVGAIALVANVACLVLIAKKRDRGAHMKASYIFSANDVIANLGVIVAGVLVTWTGSAYPDLVVGAVIAAIVLNGARRILALR